MSILYLIVRDHSPFRLVLSVMIVCQNDIGVGFSLS